MKVYAGKRDGIHIIARGFHLHAFWWKGRPWWRRIA